MTGPTGVGKSSLAVALAGRLDGEILGADAFQIYAGLPVLTAQPTPEQLATIPHHLVGFLDLSENFDAARYAKAACDAIAEIEKTDEVVGNGGELFGSGLGGENRQAGVNLESVGSEDFAIEAPGERHGEGGFADTGRPRHDDRTGPFGVGVFVIQWRRRSRREQPIPAGARSGAPRRPSLR